MKYFTETEYQQLIERGADDREDKDYPPLAKLFMTNTACTWLISELDSEYPQIAFGLCDLGMGFPELGYVDITEIEAAQNAFRQLERDAGFEGKYPLSVYANAARMTRRIETDDEFVGQFAPKPH